MPELFFIYEQYYRCLHCGVDETKTRNYRPIGNGYKGYYGDEDKFSTHKCEDGTWGTQIFLGYKKVGEKTE